MILIVVLYMLFAITFTLAKAALAYVSPFLFIGVRMMLGGSLLLLYYFFIAGKSLCLTRKHCWDFLRIIFFHIFCAYAFEFWALEYVSSSKACLMYNLSPFFTALFSYFLFAQKLSMRQLCGLILGFLGFIPILVAQAPLEQAVQHIGFLSLYEVALFFSVLSSAYGWIVMKRLINEGFSFIVINGIGMVGGGVLALIVSLIKEGSPTLKTIPETVPFFVTLFGPTIEALLILGIYSSALIIIANIICYNLYGYLLSRYSPTLLSFAGFLTPLFAALFGWIFLNETVTWHFFCTVVLVLSGLYIFSADSAVTFQEDGL